jgi:ketosteroid isomerase-like protein
MNTRARLVTRRQILRALAATAAAPSLAAGAGPESREQGDQRMAADDSPDAQRAEIMAVLERYVAAWRAGDVAALVACYHDDFTLHYFGRTPLAGDHRGRPAALRVLADVSRRTNRRLVAILDVMAGRQRGVVIAREAFQRDGTKVELDRVLVYTMREGKLHECWVYDADQALVDRFLS